MKGFGLRPDIDRTVVKKFNGEAMRNWDSLYFPIPSEFQSFFERLSSSCRFLLQREDLSPHQQSQLAKLDYALCRLPVVTVGVDFVVILCPDESKRNESYPWDTYTLELNNSFIKAANSDYNASHWKSPSLIARQSFYCNTKGYLHQEDVDACVNLAIFKTWIEGWESIIQDQGTRLTIHNFDEKFDWRQFRDHLAWEKMPSLFAANSSGGANSNARLESLSCRSPGSP